MSLPDIIKDIFRWVTSYFRCAKCFKFGHSAYDHCKRCNDVVVSRHHYHCHIHPNNGWHEDGELYNAYFGCPDCYEEERISKASKKQKKQENFAELVAQRVVEKLNNQTK